MCTIYIGLDASGVNSHGTVQIRISRELRLESSNRNDPKSSLPKATLTSNSEIAQPPYMKEGSPISLKTETLISAM
jgi:hypothetical protein